MTVVLAFGGVVGRDLDHRPVVVFRALGGRSRAHPLPHDGFYQAVKAAVYFVAGDEAGPDALVVRVLEQPPGQFRLRGEHDVVGDSGQLAALLVGAPGLG